VASAAEEDQRACRMNLVPRISNLSGRWGDEVDGRSCCEEWAKQVGEREGTVHSDPEMG
jgi:hypothetical protein